jgi:hypothetical protein
MSGAFLPSARHDAAIVNDKVDLIVGFGVAPTVFAVSWGTDGAPPPVA